MRTFSVEGFAARESPTIRQQSMRRVGTIARNPLESGRREKDQDGKSDGSEVSSVLRQVASLSEC